MFKSMFTVGSMELLTIIDPTNENFMELLNNAIEVNNLHGFIEEQPIYPEWKEAIQKMEFVRAIHGTLAIEDTGITIQEVENVIEGKVAPEQLKTQKNKEATNALAAYEFIQEWSENNQDGDITEPVIRQLNTIITRDLDYNPSMPGLYRNHSVSFGIPRKESQLHTSTEIQTKILELVDLINTMKVSGGVSLISFPIIKALTAHYLITLIHPFADGNGRVARALEALVLHHYGKLSPYCFPITAKFYYQNREEYFSLLRNTDNTGDITEFLLFAIDGLRTHLKTIKADLLEKITHSLIIDYVHELRRGGDLLKRQVTLIEILFKLGEVTTDAFWNDLGIKGMYEKLSDNTRRRDIRNLRKFNLILVRDVKTGGEKTTTISANWDVLKKITLRLDKVPHRP